MEVAQLWFSKDARETETGDIVIAHVHDRATLQPGASVTGPAVILEDGTTTVVPSGRLARIGADSEIIIEGSPA